MNHLFYTEAIRKYQLRICPFIEVKKSFFSTTLLHPYRMWQALNYSKLTRALTIRCASGDGLKDVYMPVPIGKLIPVTKDLDISPKIGDIMNFKYRAKGSPENHPMRHVVYKVYQGSSNEERPQIPDGDAPGNLDQLKQTRIEGWAKQIHREFLGAPNYSEDKAAGNTDSGSSLQGFRSTTVKGTLVNIAP